MSFIEIAITLFSLFYIFFATRNQLICFLFGGIASALWMYESYFNLNLKFDAILQFFYVFMAFYGAYVWKKGNNSVSKGILSLSTKNLVIIITAGILLSILSAKVAKLYFDTNFAYLDAATTGFSMIATYLLTKRYIENWVFWLFINPVYMYIYYKSGAVFLAGISVVYTLMSIKGWMDWKRELKTAH